MSKTINIKTNPRSKPQPSVNDLDAFVHSGEPLVQASIPKERMKRLTIDVSASLHKRIRRACLDKEVDMASEIRRILDDKFPE
jgi:hypothetical protein